MRPLNLFYEEPDRDRWLPFDRVPRRFVRRVLRGAPRPGGQQRVFLNLRAGLDLIGVPYRVNDYRHAARHPGELCCIIGKPWVLDKIRWRNPILFGASVFSHPIDDPNLFERLPVAKVLVPGEWTRRMFAPYYGRRVEAWPVGIDTARWRPDPDVPKTTDVLLYDKVLWERGRRGPELLSPIQGELARRSLRVETVRYGRYSEEQFRMLLRRSRAMVFLTEHETQGIAYQQALAAGVPILAWDRGGEWSDPAYHPERVRFGPVTSVPYWDARCGERFSDARDFEAKLDAFLDGVAAGYYQPRDYIVENLTLEQSAARYTELAREACAESKISS